MVQYFRKRSAASWKQPPSFTYTGNYLIGTETAADGTVHFDLALLTSGTLRFTRKPVKTAVFLQAGGLKGSKGNGVTQAAGANGGRHLQTEIQLNSGTSYAVVIGGSGEVTTAFGLSTEDEDGVDGALGGKSGTNTRQTGLDGAIAFDGTSLIETLNGRKYGAGGGCGGVRKWYEESLGRGQGGTTGGGRGGYVFEDRTEDAKAGEANTGSGGGGGCGDATENNVNRAGGDGGSGILLIRDIR